MQIQIVSVRGRALIETDNTETHTEKDQNARRQTTGLCEKQYYINKAISNLLEI